MTMANRLTKVSVAFLLGSTLGFANAGTVVECEKAAVFSRAVLPYQKDKYTLIKSITCTPGSPKPTFTYVSETTVNEDMIRKIDFNGIKREALAEFCKSEPMKALLTAFDVRHSYVSVSGIELGSFLMEERECDEGSYQKPNALDLYKRSLNSKKKYSNEPWRECALEIEDGLKRECFVLSGKKCKDDSHSTELLAARKTQQGVRYHLLTVHNVNRRKQNQCEVSKTGTIINIRELK